MRKFAAEDVAEDLGIAMGVGWKAILTTDAILIEHAQRAKVLELGIVVVCEAESVIRVEPAVVGMSSLARATRDDFGVRESFRHCVFEGVDTAHRRF